ncbi:hypothetical protein TYRP_015874 [Tyrophagus putrescentiae]|nr:hypothetical protein TYRP_015874 [Tyrophagus putrescentiae]
MRRIGQRPSPGVSGQIGGLLCIVHGGAQLHTQLWSSPSALVRSSGPQSQSGKFLVTRSLALARAATPPSTLGHHSIQGSSFHGPLGANSRPHEAIFGLHEAITGPHSGHLHHGHSVPSPGHSGPFTRLLRAFARPLRGHLLVTGHSHCLVSDNHGLPSIATDGHTPLRHRSTVQVRRTIDQSAILRSSLQAPAVTPRISARDGICFYLTGSSRPFSARLQRSIFLDCSSAVASLARHQAVVQNCTETPEVNLGSDGTLCQLNRHLLGVAGIFRCQVGPSSQHSTAASRSVIPRH